MESYLEICGSESTCTGCSACFNSCKVDAISMRADDEGFLYPSIDSQKCVNCGACKGVCPSIKNNLCASDGASEKRAYHYSTTDKTLLKKSSSGGAFQVLARYVLQSGGVVYGAAFDENFRVKHIAVTDIDHLETIMGSKYVQSEMGTTYSDVQNALNIGKMVLFSGTPCQINGLAAYLKKAYSNLYLVDFICHGVPSPEVWKKYLEEKEREFGGKVTSVSFRDKRIGWKEFGTAIAFENGKEFFEPHYTDPYMRAFISDLILRKSCYTCTHKGNNRASDITMGDFWGCEKEYPELFQKDGSSLLITNTKKGHRLITDLVDSTSFDTVETEKALANNPAYFRPVTAHKNRDIFYAHFRKKRSISQYCAKNLLPRFSERVVRKIKHIISGKV